MGPARSLLLLRMLELRHSDHQARQEAGHTDLAISPHPGVNAGPRGGPLGRTPA